MDSLIKNDTLDEVFKAENGMLVGNVLYEGIRSSMSGVNVGYKVLSKNGTFVGLLDTHRVAIWWTDETSLNRV